MLPTLTGRFPDRTRLVPLAGAIRRNQSPVPAAISLRLNLTAVMKRTVVAFVCSKSHVAEQGSTVARTTKDSNNDSNNNCNHSVEGERKKGNLIKANSSTGIYHQLGKSIEQPQEQLDSKRKPPVTHDLNSISDTGIQLYPSAAESKQKEIERVNERQRPPEAGNNYNSKSLSLSYCNEGGKDNNNDSDEFCQSEIFDNDSTVPESQLDFVVNDLTGDAEKPAARIQVPARKMENNYENIRPCSSSTLSHCSRKHIRRKSNISYRNYRQEDNNGRMSLSKEELEISSNNDARNKSAIPTRFFKRQDYAQPELDFPSDYSEPGGEGTTFSKRGTKVSTDLFHMPFGTRKKPQLKNINLNFPNKTTHFDEQSQQQPSNKGARQPHLVVHPVQWQKNENKYFSKAKTQILKLGQRCKLLGSTKEKTNHYISSYNLDDLIKATHKYEENEKSNLSNKIVYKSYKSELDLTKNLAYLDTFLNETFDNEPEQEAQKVRKPTRSRHGHKRAKSCSKTLDQMLMTASTTTAPLLMPQPNNARTQNLILLDDAWSDEHKKVNSEQLKNNTVSSCSRASRTNKTKLASLIKMENDFSTASVANEQNLFNDARPMMAGEKSGKSNTTSSSLSSSDYASVYSAPSPGAGGNNSSGNKIQNLKLIGTPEEALRCCSERGDFIEYSPKRHSKSRTEETDSNLDLLVLDDASYYSLRANKSHQIHNNSSNCSIGIERSHNPDPEFYPHEFHNASTLQLPRLAQQNLYPDSSSSSHRQQRGATRDPAQFRKQQNNPHHHRRPHHHHPAQQRQHHPRRWHHHRQSPLEADLTYQEDYLEHYQSTRAAAAAVGFKPAQSKGGSGASSGTIESNCDSSLEYFPNQSYHYGNTIIDNETLRNNISVNERVHAVDDDDDDKDDNDVDGEDDDSNSPDDNGVDDDDDDDNDEDDDNDDDGNPNVDNDGDSGGKIARDVIVSHDYNDRVAGRSRAHSFTNDFSQKDLLTSSRSFSRGTAVKLSQASGTVNPSFLSSYGPHRVIVSKSHKQRGELVLEYEC